MLRSPEALREETFDLLVLGGGITGAGVALDATLRGLRVALIDKGDFASGTSSVSSKLIHGGLRYLEHGDLGLVYEALAERRRLLRNAPHLVRPLRFVIPYVPGTRVRPWRWRAGLVLYDLLAGAGNLSRSRPLTSQQLRREFPGLRLPSAGGAEFFDAQMEDARLCLDVLGTAARAGACLANYVEAAGFEFHGEKVVGVRAVDHLACLEFVVRARQILNATGPWADAVARLAGDRGGPYLQPTKGVHVIAPGRGLTAAFLLLHPRDGRVLFVIPWLGKTLIGTTDTFTAEPPDALTVSPAEVDYLLEAHNYYFKPSLGPAEVLSSFAGLRPLLRAEHSQPSALSREFQVFESSSGLLSVAGGKYTTYRRMAELITDRVVQRLGRLARCRTRTYSIQGAPPESWAGYEPAAVWSLRDRYGLEETAARHLVNRYGTRADAVAACVVRDPNLAWPVVTGEPDLLGEFVYQREQEMAHLPEDFLLRRTRLGLFHPTLLQRPPAILSPPRGQLAAPPAANPQTCR